MNNHLDREHGSGNRSSWPRVWIVLVAILFFAVAISLIVFNPNKTNNITNQSVNLAKEAEADLSKRGFVPLSASLTAILQDSTFNSIPTQVHPLLGTTAPEFTLSDTDNKQMTLAESLKKGPVVLVFYYGYHCDHCVSQLFALHKDIQKFQELGCTVLAVSADKPELTRKRFEEYGRFDFPVLSDTDNNVATLYGTFKPSSKKDEKGDLLHGTFIIDRARRIAWVNRGASPFTDNKTILIEVARLEGRLPMGK